MIIYINTKSRRNKEYTAKEIADLLKELAENIEKYPILLSEEYPYDYSKLVDVNKEGMGYYINGDPKKLEDIDK